jgi:hypothetical protein
LVDRNTIIGIDFLVVGGALSALGYTLAQSIPIAAIGFNIAILGALIVLIVPEPIPQDAYKALLEDSVSNIELILEESRLEQRAYFIPTKEKQVRAFIPAAPVVQRETTFNGSSNLELVQAISKSPGRFVTHYGEQTGLLLVPPGNEIVRLSKVQEGDDLEDSLRSAIINFSDLASSIMLSEQDEQNTILKINIQGPKFTSDSPFFKRCLGSPLCCVACCVIARASGKAVRLVDEISERDLTHITIQIIA